MVTAEDFAKLARSLVNETSPEIRIRCAISRAYYAAYHFCEDAANKFCAPLTTEEKDKAKGSHDALFIRLRDKSQDASKTSDLKFIAEEAKKIRNYRVDADYKLGKTITKKNFEFCLQKLHNIETSSSAFDN